MEQQMLYNIKPRKSLSIILLFTIMILILIIYSTTKYTYEKREVVGLNVCEEKSCSIKITLDYNDIKILDMNPKIEYESKEYLIKDIEFEEPYLSNNIPVSDITIKTDRITNNNIIKFKIIYNKQRIITKIKNIIERS